MSKFKVLTGKDFCKILSDNGFVQVRQKGSHNHAKEIREPNYNSACPNHSEIKISTLQSIVRQSELSKEDFQK